MRQVSVEKPHRSSVSRPSASETTAPLSLKGRQSRDQKPEHGQRTFPPMALGLMLLVGVLLGLLFAAVISSFVDGGSSASGSSRGASSSASPEATPKAIASRQAEDLRAQQRSDEIRIAAAPEARDIRILGCGSDANGFASAKVQITNDDHVPKTYYVRVLFTSAADGRTLSDDVASVKRLRQHSTAPLQTVNAVESAPGEQVLCRLGSVTRF